MPALAGAGFRLAFPLSRVNACLRCLALHLRLTTCLDLPNGMEVTLSLVQGVREKRLFVTLVITRKSRNHRKTHRHSVWPPSRTEKQPTFSSPTNLTKKQCTIWPNGTSASQEQEETKHELPRIHHELATNIHHLHRPSS